MIGSLAFKINRMHSKNLDYLKYLERNISKRWVSRVDEAS